MTEEIPPAPALIDVRPEPEFLRGHLPGAVNLAFEQLPARTHELPPRDHPLRIADSDPDRARQAAAFLARRGHDVGILPLNSEDLFEPGPSRARLWQPNVFLVEALDRIEKQPHGLRALDVACGSGRDAVYLALRGYQVHAVDVLPDALDRARDLAGRNGVEISTEQRDLEADPTLPSARFDLVTVFRYLHRPLFPALRAAVAEGGHVVYETFHERTRQTGLPPRSAEHLLRDGELSRAFHGFEILVARDGVERDTRYVSTLLARQKPSQPCVEID